MKALRLILPVATLLAAFLASSGLSFATKEIAKKEAKPCTTCHTKAGKKDLNDFGKDYKAKNATHAAPKK